MRERVLIIHGTWNRPDGGNVPWYELVVWAGPGPLAGIPGGEILAGLWNGPAETSEERRAAEHAEREPEPDTRRLVRGPATEERPDREKS